MKTSLRSYLILLALSPLTAFAQPNNATSRVAKVGQVTITNSPQGTATYDDAQGFARITKDAVITQNGENLAIYAQQVTYLREQHQATALGQLRILTRNATVRGQNLSANFNERQFTASGNVVITSGGANDGASAGKRDENKKSVHISCDQVAWDYGKRQAIATGHVTLYRGFHRDTCDKLLYNEADNTVTLMSPTPTGNLTMIAAQKPVLSSVSHKPAMTQTKN